MIRKISLLVAVLALISCSQGDNAVTPTTTLNISTMNGDIHFNVEVARTPEELQKGLMYRTELPLTNGMIFDIYPVRPIAMWMKNTQISLDMLFIGELEGS